MTVRRAAHTLKGAIMRAAQPLGGVTNASLAIGSNRYMLAHCANPNRPEMLRLDDAIELDRLCLDAGGGTPIADFFRAALEAEEAPAVSWYTHMAAMAREGGEMVEEFANALADGKMSDRNVDDMLTAAHELGAALSNVIRQLKSEAEKRSGGQA